MTEIIIDLSESPLQKLMNYVFKNYLNFDEHCNINNKSISLKECGDCHYESYLPNGNPKYDCGNFKKCYLIRYLPRQFAQSDFLIETYVLHDIKNRTTLSAVSLGGGPAPEVLALMEGLSSSGVDHKLLFDNIEREASWEGTYRDICCQFTNYIKNVKLELGFIHSDVNSFIPEKRYDIVFISWLFSEMQGQNKSNILQVASDLVKPQGYVLIMDFKWSSLVGVISRLVEVNQGLTLLEHESRHKFHGTVDFPEDIKNIFGPHFTWESAYWVLRSCLDDIPF